MLPSTLDQGTHRVRRVLIVDASVAMCAFLKKAIDADPELEVVGYALDPYEARDMIKALNPDILTLDIELPKMDGLTFLRNLMRLRPMPVVMITSTTAADSKASHEALSIGAVNYMVKQSVESEVPLQEYTESIRKLVKSASRSTLVRSKAPDTPRITSAHEEFDEWRKKLKRCSRASRSLNKVICIGASTGGPEAVKLVLESMDASDTSVIITQHMPTRFIAAFASRLDKSSNYKVEPSYQGAPLKPGYCYVAAGESHTEVANTSNGIQCQLSSEDKINGHQPAVDALFNSAAQVLGTSAVGILLTGMGSDGAAGLKAMHEQGAFTIAQDKKSSAVWGMPGSAIRLEAADAVLSLQEIANTLNQLLKS